ncbi:MAG: septum formation protein Maf [Leptospiraceae bacterium]|nr:septum formation protein Maf [Leptospiraceae bacterium]
METKDPPSDSHSDQLVLASSSPRRQDLLRQIGLSFLVLPVPVDESISDQDPQQIVIQLSERKARAAGQMLAKILAADGRPVHIPGRPESYQLRLTEAARWILVACDTIVSLNGLMLGKPGNRAEAQRMLQQLSGAEHAVYSGLCLLEMQSNGSVKLNTGFSRTQVRFADLSRSEIEAWLDCNTWQDKAGGWAIQEMALSFVAEIHGDYSNIVGLPVPLLRKMLWKINAWPYAGHGF